MHELVFTILMAPETKEAVTGQDDNEQGSNEELLLSYGSSPPSPPAKTPVTNSNDDLPPATATLLYQAQDLWNQALQDRKPWRDFYDTKEMSFPSFTAISDRVMQNATTYRANYMLIAAGVFALSALWDIGGVLVFGLAMVGLGMFGRKHLMTHGEENSRKKVIIFAIFFLFMLWITNVGYMLAVTLFFSSMYCLLHAVVKNPQRTEFEIEPV